MKDNEAELANLFKNWVTTIGMNNLIGDDDVEGIGFPVFILAARNSKVYSMAFIDVSAEASFVEAPPISSLTHDGKLALFVVDANGDALTLQWKAQPGEAGNLAPLTGFPHIDFEDLTAGFDAPLPDLDEKGFAGMLGWTWHALFTQSPEQPFTEGRIAYPLLLVAASGGVVFTVSFKDADTFHASTPVALPEDLETPPLRWFLEGRPQVSLFAIDAGGMTAANTWRASGLGKQEQA